MSCAKEGGKSCGISVVRWFALMPRKDISSFLKLSFSVAALIVLAIILLPKRTPYVAITADAEFVAYRVVRESAAAIALTNVAVRGEVSGYPRPSDEGPARLTGRLEPAIGTVVRYRFHQGRVAVEVLAGAHGGGTLALASGVICNLGSYASFVTDELSGPLRVLPIAGPAEIGREYARPDIPDGRTSRPSDIMTGGSVLVFGRARFYPYSDALYPVSSASFPLPAGGRLSAGDALNPQEHGAPAAPWFGVAEVREGGFAISATTVTSQLRLYRMGAASEAEQFAVDAFVGPLSDPSLLFVSAVLGVLGVIAQVVAAMLSLAREEGGG